MLAAQRHLSTGFYALLSLPSTAMGFALAVQIATLSWILTTQYGLDIHDVGLVWAAGPIAGIIGQVLIGLISDKTWFWGGRRKPFIFIGGFLASMMLLAMPFIDVIAATLGTEALIGVAIAVALGLDLSINVSFNPTRSIIVDVTPTGHARTRGFTWMQTISGLFGVLAYGIGAVWNNYALIYIAAGLVLCFSIVPALLIEEPRSLVAKGEEIENSEFSLRQTLLAVQPLWGLVIYCFYAFYSRVTQQNPNHFYIEAACLSLSVVLMLKSLLSKQADSQTAFRKICTAHSLSWIAVQSMFVYMIAYVQQASPELNDVQVGRSMSLSFLLFNAVAAIVPATVLEPCARQFGRVKTHAASLAVMVIGYTGIALWGEHTWVLYTLMAVCGVGWGAIVSLPFAIVSQRVSRQKMGLFMGLFNLSVVLPQLFVSLGIGMVVSQVADKSVIFWISAAAVLLSMLAWLFVAESE